MVTLGMDIGGSHASVARISWDGAKAEIAKAHEADVNTLQSADGIINAWVDLVHLAAGDSRNIRLGIAMPGPYDYPNGISHIADQGKMKSLYGLSVKNLLAARLRIDPDQIAFTNDAEAFLLGETLQGAGRGLESSIGLTLGTGLGSAFKDGEQVRDAKLWTAPFRDGIAEDYLGTGWIRKFALENSGLQVSGMKELLAGGVDLAIVEEVLREFGTALGEFLMPYAERIDGVVLGGKISKASERFLPYTHAYLKWHNRPLEIRIAALGEQAAMLGACMPFISRSKKTDES